MRVLGFVTLLSLVHVCLGQLQVCYHSGGVQTTNDVPCDPDASNSACCGPGFICGTNLYCLTPGGDEVIGSCTDPTWQSVNCPFVLDGMGGTFSFNNVTKCTDGTLCPNFNNQICCEDNDGVELISYANTAIIPTPTDDLSAYYAKGGASIPMTASASASNSLPMTVTDAASSSAASTSTRPATTTTASPASSTPSSSPSPTSSTVMITTSISQASGTSAIKTSQASSSSSSSSSSGGLSKGASAGVGVGAALGVLIIGAAVIFFIFTRKRNNRVVEKNLPGTMAERG